MKNIIEAMLFAYGKPVKLSVLANLLEKKEKEIKEIIDEMKNEYVNRGIEIIQIDDSYSLTTKKEYYEYIYKLFENKAKPNISSAGFEVISIIAYNSNITRAGVEKIRGVNSDGTINKLLEYEIIEEAGRLDVPGRPITYKVSENFYKLFGYSSLDELPKIKSNIDLNLDTKNIEGQVNITEIENKEESNDENE
ncbi:MAG: SMC-Scp complex subunit ScpB [Clostridiales bacterium]|nr:SMC-Scp complex subunit ScpB [Clostridiales bacterium]